MVIAYLLTVYGACAVSQVGSGLSGGERVSTWGCLTGIGPEALH
jgi:hypothetical protein